MIHRFSFIALSDGFTARYCRRFLYLENPAIVAGFSVGYTDEQKTNKKSAKNVLVSKAPSERELDFAKQKTEGECGRKGAEEALCFAN